VIELVTYRDELRQIHSRMRYYPFFYKDEDGKIKKAEHAFYDFDKEESPDLKELIINMVPPGGGEHKLMVVHPNVISIKRYSDIYICPEEFIKLNYKMLKFQKEQSLEVKDVFETRLIRAIPDLHGLSDIIQMFKLGGFENLTPYIQKNVPKNEYEYKVYFSDFPKINQDMHVTLAVASINGNNETIVGIYFGNSFWSDGVILHPLAFEALPANPSGNLLNSINNLIEVM